MKMDRALFTVSAEHVTRKRGQNNEFEKLICNRNTA